MRTVRRGGLMGVVAAALLVAGALPASAASGDGSAYGASVTLTLLGVGPITAGPLAAASTDGPTEDSLATANVPGVLSAGLINTSATLDETTGQVDSSASTADPAVGVLGPANTIRATLVEATCTATRTGNSGASTLADAQLGSLGTVDANPAANTTIDVPGVASITINEQIDNDDGSLTVNAIHIRLLGGSLASVGSGDVIISSATCGPAGLPVSMPRAAPRAGGAAGPGAGLAVTGADTAWWIASGLALLVAGLFLLRKARSHTPAVGELRRR